MTDREDYTGPPLVLAEMAEDPITEFGHWFQMAIDAELPQPNAMNLATARDNRPSMRAVLLKDFDSNGFVFYTNYGSRKARQLDGNPHAAISFVWLGLHRQVRVEGTVSKISAEESDAYFATRPRGAQLAAGISRQSEVIPDRGNLELAFAAADEKFAGRDVPRPDYWGGYRLTGERFEFWNGRLDRLHDRVRYRWEEDGWIREWLSP
ncbi:MAG: pyridoxamine 5'-phosphate oxidase [Acidimicrobiia bacterium]|nr:pyridoxamine 5'-phosphate oxidase [Acidimicrobiia bacterium]